MFLELIATFAIGLGCAGLVIGLPKLIRMRAPRWLPPVAGGVAMFMFMLWNEYSWYERQLKVLSPDLRVAYSNSYSSPIQPWTLVAPRVTQFAAIESTQTNPALPGLLRATVLLAARFDAPMRRRVLIDCAAGKRIDWDDSFTTLADLETAAWRQEGTEDPLIATACATPAPATNDGGNDDQTGAGG